MLDDEEATHLMTEAAEHLSQADLPSEVADALAMGAMTTLVKDNGCGRHFSPGGGAHYGAGCTEVRVPLEQEQSVARVVRSLSIDGVRDFDHIKRKAMMQAFYTNPDLAPVLPFVRLFHGRDSKFVWYDEEGLPHGASRVSPSCQLCLPWVYLDRHTCCTMLTDLSASPAHSPPHSVDPS